MKTHSTRGCADRNLGQRSRAEVRDMRTQSGPPQTGAQGRLEQIRHGRKFQCARWWTPVIGRVNGGAPQWFSWDWGRRKQSDACLSNSPIARCVKELQHSRWFSECEGPVAHSWRVFLVMVRGATFLVNFVSTLKLGWGGGGLQTGGLTRLITLIESIQLVKWINLTLSLDYK